MQSNPAPVSRPALSDVISSPARFFEALKQQPPRPARFIWLVLLASLLSAVAGVLLSRNVLSAQAINVGPQIPAVVTLGIGIVGATIVGLLSWLLLWGLGQLGAGPAGRAAEVYGASFIATLLFAIVLLPLAALFPPQINVPPLDASGLEGSAALQAIREHTQKVQAEYGRQPMGIVGTYGGYLVYLWQFAIALIGFRTLTSSAGRAWRGVLIPAGVFIVLGLGFWLLGRALNNLGG